MIKNRLTLQLWMRPHNIETNSTWHKDTREMYYEINAGNANLKGKAQYS
jgi:hypothetical protein